MWRKVVQRQVYTFLSTRWGVVVCALACLFALSSVLELTSHSLQLAADERGIQFADNLAGKSFEGHLCSPVPIDIVYTWVNGSDPRLREAVEETKERLLLESIAANNSASSSRLLRRLLGEEDSGVNVTANNNTATNETEAEEERRDESSESRFRDNNELRYSLRSIEKNAPWVRHIYIVTNGQVPNWLDLSNPRISIVTHADIFPNQSHLPTFSSPAIESHLHRIPGVSDKFIYFNDDVMFGAEVWPDDFYTHANGQKVYLAWAVPNCAEGCPPSWINDGVCDTSCNVTECDFDGRDCVNVTASSRYNSWWQGSGSTYGGTAGAYCAPGCPDSWIGDRYCDRACSNEECGWDASDCGVDVMQDMSGFMADLDTKHLVAPPMAPAVYVNLTKVFGGGRIVEGSHNNGDVIRTATISQKYKVMTLTFLRNVSKQDVEVSVVGVLAGSEEQVEIMFNLTVDTAFRPEATNRSVAAGGNASSIDSVGVDAPGQDERRRLLLGLQQRGASQGDDSTEEEALEGEGHSERASEGVVVDEGDSVEWSDSEEGDAEEEMASEEDWHGRRGGTVAVTVTDEAPLFPSAEQVTFLPRSEVMRRAEGAGLSAEDKALWVRIKQVKEKLLASAAENAQDVPRPLPLPKDWAYVPEWEAESWPRLDGDLGGLADRHGHGVEPVAAGTRRLLDVFGDSLKKVNKLYNQEFGQAARKVPAHMPHMIDKHIMERLQTRFADEFEATSSRPFRDPRDMQFGFSYFYYLIHEPDVFELEDFFNNEIDADGDGEVSRNELRTLATRIVGTPLKKQDLDDLTAMLHNSWVELGLQGEERHTFVVFNRTTEIVDAVKTHFGKLHRQKHEIKDTDEVAFYMVGDNVTHVLDALDKIRARRNKFVCLNDNMDTAPDEVIQALQDFYQSLYPHPSSFELPPGVENEALYIKELRVKWRQQRHMTLLVVGMLVSCVIGAVYIMFRRRMGSDRRYKQKSMDGSLHGQ